MNGWIFFPRDNEKRVSNDEAAVLLELIMNSNNISKEDWNTYVPESRESLQGRSLGFFCGGASLAALKNTPAAQDMPEYPMSVFVSDFSIMPACWTFKDLLTADPGSVCEYLVSPLTNFNQVITVTSTLPDRPPWLAVYGSYCFFPPPYLVKENPKN